MMLLHEFVYRPASARDVPDMIGLLRQVMEHHEVAPPPPATMRRTLTTLLASSTHHRFLVAAGPDGLVAMCALIFTTSTWAADRACELQDVVVARDARGQGVGRALLDAAATLARQEGCNRLVLTSEAWNLGAHAFYRELGFEEKTCVYFERDL